jgi:hypothetical protein
MWYELENSDFDSLVEIKAGRGFAAEESEKLIQIQTQAIWFT